MMKKSGFILMIMATALFSGCHRTTADVWEDTKTCTRYINKGVRSLFGKHIDEEEYAYLQQRQQKGPFMSLREDDRYEAVRFEEVESSSEPLKVAAANFAALSIEKFHAPEGSLKGIFSNIHFETDIYAIK